MLGIHPKKIPYSLILLTLAILIGSCKKNEDNKPPKVKIFSPNENDYFSIPDTISVGVEVSDNIGLEYVKAVIADENYVPVTPALSRYPDSKNEIVYLPLVVSDVQLGSGVYYIIVTAFDGTHEKSEYRKITLYELPRKYMGLIFATPKPGNMVEIYKVDTLFNIQVLGSVQGDFGHGVVNSVNQAYYSAGDVYGNLNAISSSTGGINWSISSNGIPPQTYWTGITTSSTRVYVSSSDNKIQGFGKNGSTVFSANTGYRPYALYRHEDKLLCEQRQVSGNQKRLAVYQESTGALLDQATIIMEIVGFGTRDADNILVFGNEGNQGVMDNFDMEAVGFWEPHALPTGRVYDATRVDGNNFLIAHETGILWYRYNPNSLVEIVSGLQVDKLKYDDVNSRVISSAGTQIFFHNFPDGGLLQTLNHTDTVRGIDILFNK